MKKTLSIGTFALVFIFAITFNISASAFSEGDFGVSTEPPIIDDLIENPGEDISLLGLNPPSSSAVVDLTQNSLPFEGKADNILLYTDSNFKGKSKPTYNISNYRDGALTVKVFKRGSSFSTQKIVISGKAGGGSINNLDSSASYYLSFDDPSHFSGSVY